MEHSLKRRNTNEEDYYQRKLQRVNKNDCMIVDGVKFGSGLETNAQRIEMRNKQIQFGKNTVGYDNYLSLVPKEKRKSSKIHPRTPNPYDDVSKRAFDGQIKAWRRELHKWDNMELVLETGVNNVQKAIEPISDKKNSPDMRNNVVTQPTVEELEPDKYCSDGENFQDEDIL